MDENSILIRDMAEANFDFLRSLQWLKVKFNFQSLLYFLLSPQWLPNKVNKKRVKYLASSQSFGHLLVRGQQHSKFLSWVFLFFYRLILKNKLEEKLRLLVYRLSFDLDTFKILEVESRMKILDEIRSGVFWQPKFGWAARGLYPVLNHIVEAFIKLQILWKLSLSQILNLIAVAKNIDHNLSLLVPYFDPIYL